MLPEPENPKQSKQISEATLEPAGEFVQPLIPPSVSAAGVKAIPSIPEVPAGIGIEPAKEAVPPLVPTPSVPEDIDNAMKGSVISANTWRAWFLKKNREQERKVA